MGTYSKIVLSGSTAGQPIRLTATAPSTGNVLHTCVSGAAGNSIDEVWIYAQPQVTTALLLSLSLGPTTVTSRIQHTITGDDKKGLILIVPGLPGNATSVWKAWVTTTSICEIWGFVNRYAS
jgi:hypothetical protein